MDPHRTLLSLLVGLSFALALPGCEPPRSPIDDAAAAVTTVGRPATTDALHAAFLEGDITFEACLERAEAMLAAGEPGASAFAGAVLDLAGRIEDRLPKAGEFELFWRRLGQLAARATERAMLDGRLDEAGTLVLAGPARWQRGSYWQQYPNHDIMVALTMAHRGESAEAIARLRSRPMQTPAMDEAIAQIRELERRRLRETLREKLEAEQAGGG